MVDVRQNGDADEGHADYARHEAQHELCVLCRGLLEGRDAVADGLHAGQRRAAGGEGAQYQKHAHIACGLHHGGGLRRLVAERSAHKARDYQHKYGENKKVCRHAEHDRRFTHAPEISPCQQTHNEKRDPRLIRRERGESGHDGRRAGAAGHGHGQDIADRERRSRNEPRYLAEIVRADDVCAAALRICVDSLPVAEHEDQQQRDYRAHDVDERMRRQKPHYGQQHHEYLFSGVGDGGYGVAGIDRQAPQHGELLAVEVRVLQRLADEQITKSGFHFFSFAPDGQGYTRLCQGKTKRCIPHEIQRNDRMLTLTRLAVGFGEEGSPIA